MDLKVRELALGGRRAELLYYSSQISESLILDYVMLPFIRCEDEATFLAILKMRGGEITEPKDIVTKLPQGYAAVFLSEQAVTLPLAKAANREPLETNIENTILGSKYALSEVLDESLNQIRSRYPNPELIAETFQAGSATKLDGLLLFDSSKAEEGPLNEARRRLKRLHVDTVTSTGDLMLFLNETRFSLFPNLLVTERADRIALALSEGKFVLLLTGSPNALIAPVSFHDFMTSLDDVSNPFWLSYSLILLRYASLAITLFLPALYITIVSYNPEIFRMQLALSIAGSRAAVPYPSFFEVLIMLFIIEALIESSIRLPQYIGATATTVGGLILGQAAQQAGLVSSIMIIVTSTVAIANFVIPINSMSFAMRFVKYPMVLLSSLFGILGISYGMFLLLVVLCSLTSFGKPYLSLPRRFMTTLRYPRRKRDAF
ncbi:spore germination protein [Gorillibacterium sp. sgz500922]|uniref:spore germination protein n=1 Tax=Gorillibacterium sp. sgz500922 TaxID=3446694 RepID=UPI003F67DE56